MAIFCALCAQPRINILEDWSHYENRCVYRWRGEDDEREAICWTGMVSPSRKAEFEGEIQAWKMILLSQMKWRVSLSMRTVNEQCIVRYSTDNRLLERLGT